MFMTVGSAVTFFIMISTSAVICINKSSSRACWGNNTIFSHINDLLNINKIQLLNSHFISIFVIVSVSFSSICCVCGSHRDIAFIIYIGFIIDSEPGSENLASLRVIFIALYGILAGAFCRISIRVNISLFDQFVLFVVGLADLNIRIIFWTVFACALDLCFAST